MSSREDTASSEAQPHACPRLCTPLEGLRAWDRRGGFSYAFLDDTTRRELARLDASALAHRVALARDGLLELLRERGIRASPWTEDVVRHASDVSDDDGVASAPSLPSPRLPTREAKPLGGQKTVLLCFPPGLEFLVAFLACEAVDAVAVPVRPPDPLAPAERFAEERRALIGVANTSDAKLALTTKAYAAAFTLADARRKLERVFFTTRRERAASETSEQSLPFAFVPLERVLKPKTRPKTDARKNATLQTCRELEKNATEGIAFVQFTSGSTGAPKGVVVGVKNLTTNCALIRLRLGVTDEDSNVSWLPQFHDMGLVGAWLVPLTIPGGKGLDEDASLRVGGERKTFADEFETPPRDSNTKNATGVFYSPAAFAKDPASWMRVASEYRATMTQGPDFAYRLCAMRFCGVSRNLTGVGIQALNLSRLRSCLNASERAQPDTHTLFASTFVCHGWDPKAMRAGYGLAESVVYVCDGPVRVARIDRRALEEENVAVAVDAFDGDTESNDARVSSVRVSSCGTVREKRDKGVDAFDVYELDPDVRVVCPETSKELPDGRVGEIWVRGGSVAFGYVDAFAFSVGQTFGREAILLHGANTKRGGYMRTGDSGFIDKGSGEVFVVGRIKDRFKVNGRAYSPEDIERVILDAKPGVFRRGGVFAFAFEELNDEGADGAADKSSRTDKAKKKTIAYIAPSTRVGIVAEVRDECVSSGTVRDPVDVASLMDDIRRVVLTTHGLQILRRDVALVRAGAAPKTSSGKKRRDETRKLFLDRYFQTRGVALEGAAFLFEEDDRLIRSIFLLGDETSDVDGDETRARQEPETGGSFLRRLAREKGVRACVSHMETCLTKFASDAFVVNARTSKLDISSGSVDSFAAVRLTALLEFELGVSIPPTLVLAETSTPEKLARALFRLAVSETAVDGVEDAAHEDAAPDAALEREPTPRRFSVSFTNALTTVFGEGHFVRALVLVTLALAMRGETKAPRIDSGFLFSQADASEKKAHARFFEWRARVAPAQIAIGVLVWVLGRAVRRFFFSGERSDVERRVAFVAASANAFFTHGALGLAFCLAHVGARFFLEKALAKVFNANVSRDTKSTRASSSSPSRKRRVAIAWALCLAELFLLNASETWPIGVGARNRKDDKISRVFEASQLSRFLKRGALAGSTFTPTRAARYVAVRALDRSLDRIDQGADVHSDAFVDAFAFAAHPATFQCGPLVPHAAYAARSARVASFSKKREKSVWKKKTRASFGWIFAKRLRRLFVSLAPLISWCLLVDLMYVVGYRPASTFFSRNSAHRAESGAGGFFYFAQTAAFATASWITSHLVFGVPRAVAIAFDDTVGEDDDALILGGGGSDDESSDVSTTTHIVPHDTPCSWPRASTTPATFWRRFHASFFTFFFARCFAPMRGGYGGILVSVFVSTAFHGFQTKWLLWGSITAFGLVVEKWITSRCVSVRERKSREKDSTLSTFRTTLQRAVVQTATAATFVGPAVFPGLDKRAAAKVLAWGILISAVWQNAARVQKVVQKARV